MKTVIVVPFHSNRMSAEETASLRQCAKVFGNGRDIVLTVPEKLDCQPQLDLIPSARVERFDDSFFTSVSSYNRLLMTPEFYCRFAHYEYMLIYQPDAWVFRDELDYWCSRNYDYIGAPFILKYGSLEEIIIGNGGFSLRKISAMLRVLNNTRQKMFPPELLWKFCRFYMKQGKYLHALKPLLRMSGLFPNNRGKYLEQIKYEKHNSEDVVFHFLSKQFTDDGLTMPSLEEATRFSLDASPGRFFQEIPFGAHAWMKGDRDFWKEYISVESDERSRDK